MNRYFAFGPVVDGATVDGVVDAPDDCVVCPRGLTVVALPTFCGVVVAAFDGCVVAGVFDDSSSLQAVPTTHPATTSRAAVRRADFMMLLTERFARGSGSPATTRVVLDRNP